MQNAFILKCKLYLQLQKKRKIKKGKDKTPQSLLDFRSILTRLRHFRQKENRKREKFIDFEKENRGP